MMIVQSNSRDGLTSASNTSSRGGERRCQRADMGGGSAVWAHFASSRYSGSRAAWGQRWGTVAHRMQGSSSSFRLCSVAALV